MQVSSDEPAEVGGQDRREHSGRKPGGYPSRDDSPPANRGSRLNIRSVLHYTLAAVTGFFVLTGFGITHSEIVAPATGGLLDTAVSYQIHLLLWGPFLVILVLHIFVSTSGQRNS